MGALEGKVGVAKGKLGDHQLHGLGHLGGVTDAKLPEGFLNLRIGCIGRIDLERGRLLEKCNMLHPHRRFAGIVHAWFEAIARIAGRGTGHSRRQRLGWLRRKGIFIRGWGFLFRRIRSRRGLRVQVRGIETQQCRSQA